MSAAALPAGARSSPAGSRLPAASARLGRVPAPPRPRGAARNAISWVFLAGERAYKVKSRSCCRLERHPRRRACCAEEVRVNRRLAPSVYAGVVALVPRGPDGLAVAQEHDPRASSTRSRCAATTSAQRSQRCSRTAARARASLAAIGRRARPLPCRPARRRPPDDGTDRLIEVIEESLASLARVAAGAGRPRAAGGAGPVRTRRRRRGFGPAVARRARPPGWCATATATCAPSTSSATEPLEIVDAVDFEPALRRGRRRL